MRRLSPKNSEPPAARASRGSHPAVSGLAHHWVETDAYDGAALQDMIVDSPSWQALIDSGSKLLPHFDGFVLDLFALLFKLTLVVRPEDQVLPSAGFYRVLIDQLLANPVLEALRQHTALDEQRAGLASLLLGERLLAVLKSERILTRADMLDFWNLSRRESELAAEESHAATAVALRDVANPVAKRQLDELMQRLEREAAAAGRRLQQKAQQVRGATRESLERNSHRITAQAQQTLYDLGQTAEDADAWGIGLGGGERHSPGAQVELSKRLATNPKLKKLATRLGRMRAQARALRRRVFERANVEMYDISLGAELGRLLPHELLGWGHPVLRRDVARRFIDGQLLQYSLRARDEQGKGPMICCLDGSSSMAGEKEIWAKAVSLTLLEIAQRQRRLFRSICFSSADMPLQVLDLNPHQRYAIDSQRVFELAEYFPGGGTDFQKPLSAALACLRHARYKRGDIVFITDGECRVDGAWLQEFQRAKQQLGFSVVSVLIDVGANSLAALKDFSDEITTVTQLSSEAPRNLFLKL